MSSLRKKLNRSCELSCDEIVIRTMDEKEKKFYGDTLLHSIRTYGGCTNPIVSLTLNADAALMKERLGFIMKYAKKTKLHTALSIAAVVVIAFGAVLFGCVLPASAQSKSETMTSDKPAEINNTSPQTAYTADTADVPIVTVRESDGLRYYYVESFTSSYIIAIAWNINPGKFLSMLPIDLDNSYLVGFPEGLTYYADNEEVKKAVIMAMTELTNTDSNNNYALISPMVADVKGPYTASANELSEQFYKKDQLTYFSAVIKKAD